MGADFIANATEERAELEGDEGTESLLIGFVEGLIAESGSAFEETCEGKRELGKVSGLETTPDEDG